MPNTIKALLARPSRNNKTLMNSAAKFEDPIPMWSNVPRDCVSFNGLVLFVAYPVPPRYARRSHE